MTNYVTNIAAWFFVLSMLHQLSKDATFTLGYQQAVDQLCLMKSE